MLALRAHPDDEVLVAGTLARAAAEGHRVVLVVATDGGRGLAAEADGHGPELAARRREELAASARALGCARVVHLDYGDSGLHPDPADRDAFANVEVDAAVARVARLLRDERADILVVDDENGGYRHPDHVQVYRVGVAAAALASTPVVLAGTAPAEPVVGLLTLLRWCGHGLGRAAPLGTQRVFTPYRRITHRIRVTGQLDAKRAAMRAHATQRRADGQRRVLDRLLSLPRPLFGLVFGTEWFVELGATRPPGRRSRDIFSGCRP